jgi:hypothetical protein
MGKKYLPLVVSRLPYKLYLDDVKRIHQKVRTIIPSIPSYYSKSILRKPSSQTQPDLAVLP